MKRNLLSLLALMALAGCSATSMHLGANPPGTYTSMSNEGIKYRPSAKYYPGYGYGYWHNGNFWEYDNNGTSSSHGRRY